MTAFSLNGIAALEWPEATAETQVLEGASLAAKIADLETLDLETAGQVYLMLDGDTDTAALPTELGRYSGIGIIFPRFNDGRGFSLAVRLRRDFEYQGEIRAFGPVIPDQAQFLLRAGFDSVAETGDRLSAFQASVRRFQKVYQSDVRGTLGAAHKARPGIGQTHVQDRAVS